MPTHDFKGTLNGYIVGAGTVWTPYLKFGGAAVDMAYATQAGLYIKIGNLVWFSVSLQLSNKGSSLGNATISVLPVTPHAAINLMFYGQGDDVTVLWQALLQGTSTTLALYTQTTTPTPLTDANFTNTSVLRLWGCYIE